MSSPAQGHLWTLKPFFGYWLNPISPPPSTAWRAEVLDSDFGPIRLTGRLATRPEHDAVAIIVHGLGGSSASYYAQLAALAADRVNLASLRVNLRGADRRGEDFYHAGLTSDLAAAIASPALARYERIYLLGYSLGGHLVLRYLSERPDVRVRAAAVVCAPVDLAASAREIDRPARAGYRRHILRGLKDMYREVASRRPMPLAIPHAERIKTIYDWDDLIIAPRHGFDGAPDYYERMSAWPRLEEIRVPTLFIASEYDPMVLIQTVRPRIVDTAWLKTSIATEGGHVGFPRDADLGLGLRGSVADQALQWMLSPT